MQSVCAVHGTSVKGDHPPASRSLNLSLQRDVCNQRDHCLSCPLRRLRRRAGVAGRPLPQDRHSQWSLHFAVTVCRRRSHAPCTESLEVDKSVAPQGSLEDDLDRLDTILEDNVPAYVLTRLDAPSGEWLTISYVPDSAKIRDKVRASLSDTMFRNTSYVIG